MKNDEFCFATCRFAFFNIASPLTGRRAGDTIQRKFIDKAMRKQSTPELLHPRERAMVRIPHGRPGEEPFQVQTQRRGRSASRGGVRTARYNRRGLMEPAEKQIRWHHEEAAFVLKYRNEVSPQNTEVPFYVFDLRD